MKILLCTKLSRTWLLIWLIGMGIYLSTRAIKKYLEFKELQFENVPKRTLDQAVITMYLTSIIIAIAAAVCCAICLTIFTGNYANDSSKFGKNFLDFKSLRMKLHREQINNQLGQTINQVSTSFGSRFKYHFPAFFSCFYFVMSFSFVLMIPYLDSERIRFDMDLPDSIWNTNLDFLFQTYANSDKKVSFKPMSPEFFNLCISLVIQAFSYPSVFWSFNKFFSFIFTVVILFNGVVFMLDLALVEMLIKLTWNSEFFPSMKLEFIWIPFLSILSISSFLLMMILQISLFEYGYNRMKDSLIRRPPSDINDNCNTYNNSSNISLKLRYVWKQLCIESWNRIMWPFVIGILSTVFSILVKLPYIYKSMRIIYAKTNMNIVLVNVVVLILYLVFVVILWICLILKSDWPIEDDVDPVKTANGDCKMYLPKRSSDMMTIPVYASVNRHPPLSPPVDQEPAFPIFCDKMQGQWRYSCSPPSCAPNDSNSNSDVTVSGKNQDIGSNKKNYIFLSRINPGMDSPNFNQGIYSQLVKLTPQLSLTDNPIQSDNIATPLALSNDASDNSSNQTVHIIGAAPLDLARRTIERGSLRIHSDMNKEGAATEYFNIVTSNSPLLVTRQLYEPITTNNTDAESNNLCTQV